jgi:hypothetical protein
MIHALIATLLIAAPPPPLDNDALEEAKSALPESTLIRCGGSKKMCFELEPYKSLIGLSYERLFLQKENTNFLAQIGQYKTLVSSLHLEAAASDKQVVLWKGEHGKMYEKWKEENKLRHEFEAKAYSPWPYVQMAIGGIVGASGALWGTFDSGNVAPWLLASSGAVTLIIGFIDAFID